MSIKENKSVAGSDKSVNLEDEIIIRLDETETLDYSDLDNMEYEEVNDDDEEFEGDEYSNLSVVGDKISVFLQ